MRWLIQLNTSDSRGARAECENSIKRPGLPTDSPGESETERTLFVRVALQPLPLLQQVEAQLNRLQL